MAVRVRIGLLAALLAAWTGSACNMLSGSDKIIIAPPSDDDETSAGGAAAQAGGMPIGGMTAVGGAGGN
jgi:hypothetical protein